MLSSYQESTRLDGVTVHGHGATKGAGERAAHHGLMVSHGRSFSVVVAAIGLAMLVTFLSERPAPDRPAVSTTSIVVADDTPTFATAEADGRATAGNDREPSLRVRVQMPTTMRAGGGRQLRISLQEGRLRTRDHRRDSVLRLDLRVKQRGSQAGTAFVSPDAIVLHHSELRWTRFDLYVGTDVGCDARLGELHVRVTEIGESPATGERTIKLPPVDCQTPPPAADSVHDMTPRCLDGLELQEWVLEVDDPPIGELCQEPRPPSQRRSPPSAGPKPAPPDEPPDPAPDGEPEPEDASDDEETSEDTADQPDLEGSEDAQDTGDSADPSEAPPDQDPSADIVEGSSGSDGSDSESGELEDQDDSSTTDMSSRDGADVAEQSAGDSAGG